VVFHLAGTLKASGSSGFRAVNTDGTANLVAAVQAAAPAAQFVLVSSLAAAGPSVDGRGTDLPPDRCRPVSAYGDSKRGGELAVVASPLPWVIVRPPAVYGSGDEATRLLFRQACGVVAPVPRRPAPLSLVAVADLAEALLLAPAACGRRLFVPIDGRDRTDTHALVRDIAAACGRRARLLPVPGMVASAAAMCCDMIARLRGTSSFFNRDKVREIAAVGWVADGSVAARELGFVPTTPLADGLRAVAAAEGLRAVTSGAA
jgi:nucleoside-diphosphate-sugar epimerase